jgi:hypothetical protein
VFLEAGTQLFLGEEVFPGQPGIAVHGGPAPADEHVVLRIWPERATSAAPDGPPLQGPSSNRSCPSRNDAKAKAAFCRAMLGR